MANFLYFSYICSVAFMTSDFFSPVCFTVPNPSHLHLNQWHHYLLSRDGEMERNGHLRNFKELQAT